MTTTAGPLVLTADDVARASAHRDCPWCGAPLLINLPSLKFVLEDLISPALKLELPEMTATERRLFNALYAEYPNAVEQAALAEVVDTTLAGLKEHGTRLRRKLLRHGWRLARRYGTYRLVAPEGFIPPSGTGGS